MQKIMVKKCNVCIYTWSIKVFHLTLWINECADAKTYKGETFNSSF